MVEGNGQKWISQKFICVNFRDKSKKNKFQEFSILNALILKKLVSEFICKKLE